MIQINAVITALMVTWVRRHISQSDSSWFSLLKIYVNSVFTKGENYADRSKAVLLMWFILFRFIFINVACCMTL